MDWDRALAQLSFWPLSMSKSEIGKLTPRELFTHWQQLNELREAFSKVVGENGDDKQDEVIERLPEPAKEPEPQERNPIEVSELTEDDVQRTLGDIAGLGFGKYACYKEYPGETEGDPFSLPREIVKDRFEAMVIELCKKGWLQQYGVPEGNQEAAREYFDAVWGNNCRIFDQIVSAMKKSEDDGRADIVELAIAGDLVNYMVAQGDTDAASRLYDHLKVCWHKPRVKAGVK